MINCLIVDDEPIARSIIKKYVLRTPGLQFSGQLDNALEVVDFIKNKRVDLIFLDINMPEITGIDLLKSLYRPPQVIITTAYSEYGAESYNYDVVDYLLKPISFDRFLKAIQKVSDPEVENKNADASDCIYLKEDKTTHKIIRKQIHFVQAFGNYVKVHTDEKTLIVRKTLHEVGDLMGDDLVQIHKSYLVAKHAIKSMDRESVTLESNDILPISNSYRDNTLNLLK